MFKAETRSKNYGGNGIKNDKSMFQKQVGVTVGTTKIAKSRKSLQMTHFLLTKK